MSFEEVKKLLDDNKDLFVTLPRDRRERLARNLANGIPKDKLDEAIEHAKEFFHDDFLNQGKEIPGGHLLYQTLEARRAKVRLLHRKMAEK